MGKSEHEKEVLGELKMMNYNLRTIIKAFKSWQSQDEHYHKRHEKMLKEKE